MSTDLPLYDNDDGRVCWFGLSWDAPINENRHVDTPVGVSCVRCTKPFEPLDQGVTMIFIKRDNVQPVRCAFHLACHLEEVLGPSWKELTS